MLLGALRQHVDDLREVEQGLVDGEAFLESLVLRLLLGRRFSHAQVPLLCTRRICAAEVVRDLFTASKVDEVQVALHGEERVVRVSLTLVLCQTEAEERVRTTRAMVQLGLCVVPVALSKLNELQHLFDVLNGYFVRTFDDKVLRVCLVDG